jgi:hypothetical protein
MKLFFAVLLFAFSGYLDASPIYSISEISEAGFVTLLSGPNVKAYAKYRVGDDLYDDWWTLGPGPQPELIIGHNSSSITSTANFDWPANWMYSSFSLAYQRQNSSLSLLLTSSDPNSRPFVGYVNLSDVTPFDTLLIGGTALTAALYASVDINGRFVTSLQPNGYGYSDTAHFKGYKLTGDVLSDDFIISGSVYFDGGTQTGDSNRVEFGLVRQIPEPHTLSIIPLGLILLSWFSMPRCSANFNNSSDTNF